MLTHIHPKLPMRSKEKTKTFYVDGLGFKPLGKHDYPGYLMLERDLIEIHFFEFATLNSKENYGQVYIRVKDIDAFYNDLLQKYINIHPNGNLEIKPWGQKEFSLLDPDSNLLTFGEAI